MQSLTNGGLSRNRTNDTRIFSPLLYQLSYETTWLREKDLNQRPPGYEPDELPDCSIPRCELIKMAQKLGFEPRRRSHDLPVFKTGPFSHLGTSAYVQFVDPVGFEPTTFRLEGECSVQLS